MLTLICPVEQYSAPPTYFFGRRSGNKRKKASGPGWQNEWTRDTACINEELHAAV